MFRKFVSTKDSPGATPSPRVQYKEGVRDVPPARAGVWTPLPHLPRCQGAQTTSGVLGAPPKGQFFSFRKFCIFAFFCPKSAQNGSFGHLGFGVGGGANFFVSVPGQKKSATRTVFSCPNPHTPGPYIEPFPNQVRPRPKKQKKESKAKREVCTHLPFSEMLLVGFFLDV